MSDHDQAAAERHFQEPTRPAFDRAAHLAHLLKLADAHEAKKIKFGFTVTDRTPAGYGPTA